MTRPRMTHYLRENRQERIPHRLLVIDTETLPASDAERDRQVLRLWAARLLRRPGHQPKEPRTQDWAGYTAQALADLVAAQARSDATLWVFAHNLNFDLAVTALPLQLAEQGWQLTEGALTSDAPWCRMRKGRRRLAIVDSWSWLPAGVAELGKLVSLRKLDLPDWQDEDADWFARCRRDVEIVAKALTQVLDWWESNHLGNWSVTGPATGWSSYRHMRPAPRVLVAPDDEARAFEMRAVSGGRRQVTRTGPQPAGLYADLDLTTAHLVAMAEHRLPWRRLRRLDGLELDDPRVFSTTRDLIAECDVETTSPRYPWRSRHGVFYPVGRFTTVLAGPELREAHRRGELRRIGTAWVYAMSEHMAPWARWLATVLDTKTPGIPKVVRLMAKGWSRSVPGKWAGHTSELLDRRPDPRPGWSVEPGYVSEGRRRADFLLLAGERLTIARDEWADDAFPAILAFIQSYTRVALNRLIDRAGAAWLTCNTDGALVDVAAILAARRIGGPASRARPSAALQALDHQLDAWAPELAPFVARIKKAAGAVTVISPQHLILGRERKLAGIPRKAVRLARGRYRFDQWPKLRVQLARDFNSGYTTQTVTRDLTNVPPAGWLYADGSVAPVTLWPDAAGRPRVSFPDLVSPSGAELELANRQHPTLRRVLQAGPWQAPGPEPTGRPLRPAAAGVA